MEISRTLLLLAIVLLHNVLDVAAFFCGSRLVGSPSLCSTTFAVRRPRVDVPDFTIIDDANDGKQEGEGESDGAEILKSSNEHETTDDSEDSTIRMDRTPKPDRGPRREETGNKKASLKAASWMQRNKVFTNDDSEDRDDRFAGAYKNEDNTNFRQNFRGTRVFVTGLPDDVTWQVLKDHFRQAGEVVFASVSADMETGKSKGYGVVQYETTHEALKAIETMRDFPLNGSQLCKRYWSLF